MRPPASWPLITHRGMRQISAFDSALTKYCDLRDVSDSMSTDTIADHFNGEHKKSNHKSKH
jgi:hypothetical protein